MSVAHQNHIWKKCIDDDPRSVTPGEGRVVFTPKFLDEMPCLTNNALLEEMLWNMYGAFFGIYPSPNCKMLSQGQKSSEKWPTEQFCGVIQDCMQVPVLRELSASAFTPSTVVILGHLKRSDLWRHLITHNKTYEWQDLMLMREKLKTAHLHPDYCINSSPDSS